MTKLEMIQALKNTDRPIVICGAGIIGERLLDICRAEEISITCFCDGSIKTSGNKCCGLEIIHTPSLHTRFDDAVCLISAVAIKDVVEMLQEQGFNDWYAGGVLLKDIDITQDNPDASLDYLKFAIDNCILCHDGYLHPDKLFLRSIDLIITERCSLRCRDCSNLMQYYEHPVNCDSEMLLRSIDRFCDIIDEVMDFRIIGGETFMNREWHIPTAHLIDNPKARRIVLYTNATILPDPKYTELLQHEKVLIIATDYGAHLSRKLPEFRQYMEENHIRHNILKMTEWLDCSAIGQHNRTEEQNQEIFKLCCAKNMATLSDGKLFRCPYAANAFRLQAVPDCPKDYVDIFSDHTSLELKTKMKDYLESKDYLSICDYCNGRPLSGVEVEPAIQAEQPLPYKKILVED